MQRILTLSIISIAIGSSTASGQTLTLSGNTPAVGGEFVMHATAYTDPGASGAGVVWDFTALGTDSIVHYSVVDPASSAHASLFPNASYAITNSTSDTLFYEVTAGGLELVGEDVTYVTFDVQVPYTDNVLALQLPCSNGTSWVDDLSATYDITGLGTADRSGSFSGFGDATGMVQLPWGSFGGLLRVHTRLQQLDDAGLAQANHNRDEWAWYTEWSKFPVLRIWADTIAISFPISVTQIVRSTEWMDSTFVGMSDPVNNAFGLELYPNPAGDQVTLTFGAFERKDMTMTITDALGRVVVQEGLGDLPTGFHRQELDIASLAPGHYALSLMDARGDRSVRSLVIE